MYPHVSKILGGDVIAKPFMASLVDDDKIPLHPPAGARAVPPEIPILVFVAISDRALVFHAQVSRFNQLEAVFIERIGAEPVFKGPQHGFHVCIEMRLGLVLVFTQHPVVQIKDTVFTLEGVCKMHVIADVGSNVVVVDGVAHEPVETGVTVTQILAAAEPAIGDIGKAVGNADADQHAIHFIRLVILVGPPYAGPQALACRRNPMFSVAVFLEIKPAIPRCPLSLQGMAGVVYPERVQPAFFYWPGEINKYRVKLAFKREFLSLVDNLVDPEVIKQINLEP